MPDGDCLYFSVLGKRMINPCTVKVLNAPRRGARLLGSQNQQGHYAAAIGHNRIYRTDLTELFSRQRTALEVSESEYLECLVDPNHKKILL